MKFKKFGTAILVILSLVIIFQNCGRVVLSDKVSSLQSQAGYISAVEYEANYIITAMKAAGVPEMNEFNDKIDYSADSMICGNPVGSTQVECRFKIGTKEYRTTDESTTKVQIFLRNMGVPRQCPTCQDSESYTVTNVYCVKNPKVEKDVNCSLKRP